MAKIVVLINGRAQAGKDTFVRFVRQNMEQKGYFKTYNRSKTDLVREALKKLGWNGEKTDYVRAVMKGLTDFADHTGRNVRYFKNTINMLSGIVFFHVRDLHSISKYSQIAKRAGSSVITLFVHRDATKARDQQWTDLEDYDYDYRILNNGTLEDLQKEAELFADLLFQRLTAKGEQV